MSERAPSQNEYACFPLPDEFSAPSLLAESRVSQVLARVGIDNQAKSDGSYNYLLSGLSTKDFEALSRLIPSLMCGEESATHVFQQEAKRLEDTRSAAASASLLAQIAREEAEHEVLLGIVRRCIPTPEDFAALRRRARFFFLRLVSRDPATHFARIVGLDSGVCITLSSLIQPSAAVFKAPLAYRMAKQIWQDEARHVRISRQHVIDLGIDRTQMIEEGRQARKGLAELLLPLADDFEDMGVDPDKLFRRINGSEEV